MDRLDLVIEVIWTSGSIDKLEIWPLSPGRAKRAAAGARPGTLVQVPRSPQRDRGDA
jgi:hypothetical protein